MKELDNILAVLAATLQTDLKNSAKSKGLVASGKGIESIQVKPFTTPNSKGIIETHEHYMGIMDRGVKANKVPFSGVGSGAKKSLYIEGLVRWVKQKGLESDDRKALSRAFAIAYTHKKKGIPTDKGKLGWLTEVLTKAESFIVNEITRATEKDINIFIDNLVRDVKKRF